MKFHTKQFLIVVLGVLVSPFYLRAAENIQVGTTTRNMIVYAPQGISKNRPLLISMHGMNQDAAYQQSKAQWELVADTAKFVVVYPNGINKRWDISGTTDIDLILTIIDTMYNRYGIDRKRVYLSGFSMGGMMTYWAAVKIADKIAAFGPVSVFLLRNPVYTSSRPVPIIHVHGDADDVVVYSNLAPFLDGWIKRDNCPTTPVITKPYPEGKTSSAATKSYWGPGDAGVEIVLLTIAGKGHWHSNDPVSINTSGEIWNFVKRYSLK
jgi:poly(3-hydroxybutyrate) depolymerase